MYVGYLISEVGMCLLNPMNLPILAVSAALYGVRARDLPG